MPRSSSTDRPGATSSSPRSPATPWPSAARGSPAAELLRLPLWSETGSCPTSTRSRRRLAPGCARLGQLPEQPDGRRGADRPLRAARRAGRASTGSCSPPTRPTASSTSRSPLRAPSRSPPPERRLRPQPEQALVDDRLPRRVRRGLVGGNRGAEALSPVGRNRTAGVRPARGDRRVERRGARVRGARAIRAQARDPPAGARAQGAAKRGRPDHDVPLAGAAGRGGLGVVRAAAARSTGSWSRPERSSGPRAKATSASPSFPPRRSARPPPRSWRRLCDRHRATGADHRAAVGAFPRRKRRASAGAVEEAIDLLDRRRIVRVSREAGRPAGRANEWAKKAILLSFRLRPA